MGDKDQQRATNPLTAFINQQSLAAMPGGAIPSASNNYLMPNGPTVSSDHQPPIRRHNLTLQQQNGMVGSAFPTSSSFSQGGFMSPSMIQQSIPTSSSVTSSLPSSNYNLDNSLTYGQSTQASLEQYLASFSQPPTLQPQQIQRGDGEPPRKRLTRIEDHSPAASGASTPSSSYLPNGINGMQLHSAANSVMNTPPGQYLSRNGSVEFPLRQDDENSSPPVIAPGQKRGRQVIEDDESQATQKKQPPVDFAKFKAQFQAIPDQRLKQLYHQTGGDIQATSAILVKQNPLLNLSTAPPPPVARSAYPGPARPTNFSGQLAQYAQQQAARLPPAQQRPQYPTPQQLQQMQMMQGRSPQAVTGQNFYQMQQSGQMRAPNGQMPIVSTRMVKPQNGNFFPHPGQPGQPGQPPPLAQNRWQPPAAKPRVTESKYMAAHRAIATPGQVQTGTPQQQKKRKQLDSDEEDDGRWSDHSGQDFEEDAGPDPVIVGEAIEFFNQCQPQELLDYTACTLEIANQVIEMRPFVGEDDVREKLKRTKGISNKLFDNLVEILQAYRIVDQVFEQCDHHGKVLANIMRIWSGSKGEALLNGGKKLSVPASNATSRAGSPDTEGGLHMTHLDEDAFQQSQNVTAQSDVREAFEGYIKEQPKLVPSTVTLKGYQMLGINWLKLLYTRKLSCILADDMGLGKTCQVISFFAHLKEIGKPGPHLVVVPSSTLDNWLREFDTFAPDLKVYSYYGTQAARAEMRHNLKQMKEIDVIVTTYNMASGGSDDKRFLKKMEFATCVYDEGHQLKNSNSKKHKELMELRVKWRLLLTGTPLQNNLVELVSLLSFILPEVFRPAQDSLQAIFKVPPDAQANMLSRRRIEAAKSVMTPFVLRRKKLQVLQELPKKIERIEYCTMTATQRDIYRNILINSKKTILEVKKEADPIDSVEPRARTKVKKSKKADAPKMVENSSNVLMELRKAACHPMLFRRMFDDEKISKMSRDCLRVFEFSQKDPKYILEDMSIMTDFELHRFVQPYEPLHKYSLENQEWMDGGKIKALKRLLPKMRAQGDRILLFSQFTMVLDLLELVLDTMGFRYLKLTGQTNVAERQGLVDDFYEDKDITVFLLSTRAGGLGLNLAAANVVIIYDQDFNPHNDRQAEDRAWRIGQTRDVNVIRLIVRNTIEEQMMALANTKLALDSQVSKVDDKSEDGQDSGAEIVNETVAEKKIKQTLISSLRAQLELGDIDVPEEDEEMEPEEIPVEVDTPMVVVSDVAAAPVVGEQSHLVTDEVKTEGIDIATLVSEEPPPVVELIEPVADQDEAKTEHVTT